MNYLQKPKKGGSQKEEGARVGFRERKGHKKKKLGAPPASTEEKKEGDPRGGYGGKVLQSG